MSHTRKDAGGILYTPPAPNAPPIYGTPVTIHNGNGGSTSGTIGSGGHVVPNN